MKEFKTPNSKTLQLEDASFEDACELNSLICRELLNANISLSLVIQEIVSELGDDKKLKDLTFSDILAIPSILELVSRTFLSIISSKEIRDKIFKCLERSLLNKERITKDSFEKENRGDFLFICKKCLEVNILCFIPALS
jgi:hypothetical protein